MPDRSRGARQRHPAREEPVDRGDDAEHRLDVREGALRIRLRNAPRPADEAAHSQGLGEARRRLVVGAVRRADREVGSAQRSVDASWPRRRQTHKRRPKFNPLQKLPLLDQPLGDARDRVATPASWYEPFREATWDEALDLAATQMLKLRDTRGPNSLAVFSSAKCTNEENYLLQRLLRAAIGTNNIDHCTRLCHSSSVSAMQRAMSTSAASGLDARGRDRERRHLHPRRQHHGIASGVRRRDQAGAEARRDAHRRGSAAHRARAACGHPSPDAPGHRRRAAQLDAPSHLREEARGHEVHRSRARTASTRCASPSRRTRPRWPRRSPACRPTSFGSAAELYATADRARPRCGRWDSRSITRAPTSSPRCSTSCS